MITERLIHFLFRYIREGTLLHNYAHILAILLRLRQLCCHPFLVKIAAERAKQLGSEFFVYDSFGENF